jgi:hypothetical protein
MRRHAPTSRRAFSKTSVDNCLCGAEVDAEKQLRTTAADGGGSFSLLGRREPPPFYFASAYAVTSGTVIAAMLRVDHDYHSPMDFGAWEWVTTVVFDTGALGVGGGVDTLVSRADAGGGVGPATALVSRGFSRGACCVTKAYPMTKTRTTAAKRLKAEPRTVSSAWQRALPAHPTASRAGSHRRRACQPYCGSSSLATLLPSA